MSLSKPAGFVYALSTDGCNFRYVGGTKNSIAKRLSSHKTEARYNSRTPVHCWIREVGFDQVIASQLEVCATIDALEEAEKLQTALLLARGCDLLNMRRDGWRGVADYDPAESLVRRQTALKALADAKTSVWSAAQRLRA